MANNNVVLASDEWAGGRPEEMSALEKAWLGARQGLSRSAYNAADFFYGSELFPEYFKEWKQNLRTGNAAVQSAGGWGALGDIGAGLGIDAAMLAATRGKSLPAQIGAQTGLGVLTGGDNAMDRGIAGLLTGVGAGGGALAGMGSEVVANTGKSLVQPFTKNGRRQIVRDVLLKHSSDPKNLLKNLDNVEKPYMAGTKITLGEMLPQDAGLSNLQRAAAVRNPDFMEKFGDIRRTQDLAYMDAFDKLTGNVPATQGKGFRTPLKNELQKDYNVDFRAAKSQPFYDAAESTPLRVTKRADELKKDLLQRPAFRGAVNKARLNNANRGNKMDLEGSINGLQTVDKSLAGMIGKAARKGDGDTANAIGNVRKTLDRYLGIASPDYLRGRRLWAVNSQPVNRNAVAEEFRRQAFPASSGASSTFSKSANHADTSYHRTNSMKTEMFSKALLDGDKTATNVLGVPTKLEDLMGPTNMSTLENISRDLSRRNMVDGTMTVKGSPTAQYLAFNNVLDNGLYRLLSRNKQDFLRSMMNKGASGLAPNAQLDVDRVLSQALRSKSMAKKILNTKGGGHLLGWAPTAGAVMGYGAGELANHYLNPNKKEKD